MSNTPEVQITFSPFHAVLNDGFDRMIEFVPSTPFTFTSHDDDFGTTLSEAILVSPKVSESVQSNPLKNSFEFAEGSIQMTDLGFSLLLFGVAILSVFLGIG
jgi:hypothetical protein